MNKKDKGKLICINLIYVLALCAVIAPLLWISQYNRPSADDWSYGRDAYKAIQQGTGLFGVLKISFATMARHYVGWEGRFMNSFFASLQPGIWGEHCYAIVGWLMIGSLIIGELLFFRMVFCGTCKQNRYLWIPVAVPSLMMQILYTPSTVESFYWYTGAVNYTFIFALSMIFMALFYAMALDLFKGWKKVFCGAAAAVLAVVTGGDNFSTSLSLCLSIPAFWLWISVKKSGRSDLTVGKVLKRTWYLLALEGGSLAACILAPGNTARLNGNFGGAASNSVLWAVCQSFVRTATNSYSWTNAKIFVMLLLTVPFIWLAVKEMQYSFPLPGLFSLLIFWIYASQITATLYVYGTTGGGRAAAILYYGYHVMLLLNLIYWLGWLVHKAGQRSERPEAAIRRFLLLYCGLAGALLAGMILTGNLRDLSCYRAYRDWRQGWAQQYAAEWDARLEVLRDDTVSEVVFEPLTVCPETILYTDLQDKDGFVWVNKACANYYDKESITIVKSLED